MSEAIPKGLSLLTWIHYNPSIDKQSYAKHNVRPNYLSISKLHRLYRWSLGMDKWFLPTLYKRCNYLSMQELNYFCRCPSHVSANFMSWTSKHADDLRTAYQWVRSYTLYLILKIRTFCPSLHKLIKDDTRCPFHLQHNEPKSGTVNSRILTAKRLLEFIPGIIICIVGRFFPFFLEANHWKYSQNMWCT